MSQQAEATPTNVNPTLALTDPEEEKALARIFSSKLVNITSSLLFFLAITQAIILVIVFWKIYPISLGYILGSAFTSIYTIGYSINIYIASKNKFLFYL